MATVNVGILTTAGKALVDRVNAGQTKVTYSKIVFSSMDNSALTDEQVKALTSVTPADVTVSVPETTLDSGTGEAKVRGTGDNQGLTSGVYIKTYGVYAKDDKGSEILYGVTVSDHPNYLVAYDGLTPQSVTYTYRTVISLTDNVNFTSGADVYTTEQDLKDESEALRKDYNDKLDSKADDASTVHKIDVTEWQQQAIFKKGSYFLAEYAGTDFDETAWVNFLKSDKVPIGLSIVRMDPKMKTNLGTTIQVLNIFVEKESADWIYLYGIPAGGSVITGSVNENNWSGFRELDSGKFDNAYRGVIPDGTDWNDLGTGVWSFLNSKNSTYKNMPNVLQVHPLWGTVSVTNRSAFVSQKIVANEMYEFKREFSGVPGNWFPWTGINGTMEQVSNPDLDNFHSPGSYYVVGTNILHDPISVGAWGMLRIHLGIDVGNNNFIVQEFIHNETAAMYRRAWVGYRNAWSAWVGA